MLRQNLPWSHLQEIRFALLVVGEAVSLQFCESGECLEAVAAGVTAVFLGVDWGGVGTVQYGSYVVQMPVHFS